MVEDSSPSMSSSGARYASSTKNTRPSGVRQSATSDQKDANRSAGTCDSQNPKKTTSYRRSVHGRDVRGVTEQLVGPYAGPAGEFEHTAGRPERVERRGQLGYPRKRQRLMFVLRGEGPIVGDLLVE